MAKFGINDILNAKTKAAGAPTAAEGYKEIYLSPYEEIGRASCRERV